jgi:hypothetical protein
VTQPRLSANVIYILTITPKVCDCQHGGRVFATGRVPERVIARAESYWAVWEAFYGDQAPWLDFAVVDRRDGQLIWLNGASVKGNNDGTLDIPTE